MLVTVKLEPPELSCVTKTLVEVEKHFMVFINEA